MAEQLMNGKDAFIHPVTHRRVGPFEFYEGFAHQKHEGLHDKKSLAKMQKEADDAKAAAEAEKQAADGQEDDGGKQEE